MNSQHSYMSIKALAEALHEMSERLENGQLSAEEVGGMLENARALYERLVVLHFKAFEEEVAPPAASVTESASPEEEKPPREEVLTSEKSLGQNTEEPTLREDPVEPEEPMQASEPEVAQAPDQEPPAAEEERPSFRFATPEVAPNQISLIDSIEEIKRMERSINDKFKDADSKSLADQLKKKPIADLKAAIGINMRFQFTTTLFENDPEAYSAAVEKLNSCSSFLEADDYVNNTLKDRYDWQMKNPVVRELIELVERRYL